MTDETVGESRQFDKVLSRLDALMKRNQASHPDSGSQEELSGPATVFMSEPEEPEIGVPVLTEIYQGEELQPVEVIEQNAPPVLTHQVYTAALVEKGSATEQKVALKSEREKAVQTDTEAVIDDLMPHLREMVVRVIQEEIMLAQQTLQARVLFEAEQVLRRRLNNKETTLK